MFCPSCGTEVNAQTIVCPSCSILIIVPDEEPPEPDLIGNEEAIDSGGISLLRSIKRFIPMAKDRIVRCSNCGMDNIRGVIECVSCNYIIDPPTLREEMVMVDDEVVKRLSPRLKNSYFKLGCQLIMYRIFGKTESYPCESIIEYPDNSSEKCGHMLTFKDSSCKKCHQSNDIWYYCMNFNPDDPKGENSCQQRINLEMLRCPNCGAETLLNQLLVVIGGIAMGSEAKEFVGKYIQPHFPLYPLLKDTLSSTLPVQNVREMKFNAENACLRGATIFEWLASFLQETTKPRGDNVSMRTSIGTLNRFELNNLGGSIQRSPELESLRQERIEKTTGTGQPSPVVATGEATDDEDNMLQWGRI